MSNAEQRSSIYNNLEHQDFVSHRRILPALLLCFFFGLLGFHRFYVGKIGTGIIWLLTGGIFGIGALVDFILIIIGSFRDKEGRRLSEWV